MLYSFFSLYSFLLTPFLVNQSHCRSHDFPNKILTIKSSLSFDFLGGKWQCRCRGTGSVDCRDPESVIQSKMP